MTKWRLPTVWLGCIGALVLGVLSGFALSSQTSITRVSMVFSVAAMLLSLFAIPFFLTGLRQFKIGLQQAYIILCIGIGVFGLAQVQLPLINIYNIGFWVESGGIALPYLVGVMCLFGGMRSLSRLLSLQSPWRSGLLALLVTVLISLGAALLPHVKVTIDELSYHIALALSIWNSVFITFAAVIAYKVRSRIGLLYMKSMDWLYRAFVILSFAGWHYTAVQLTFTVNDWYYDYSIALLPFIAGALALVIAGYKFGSITSAQDSLATSQKKDSALPANISPAQELDVVLYVANLVSNPSDVADIMDSVRAVASKIPPGQIPSPDDQEMLHNAYSQLEDYLLHRDALRVFTPDELHGRIIKRFGFGQTVKTALWQ